MIRFLIYASIALGSYMAGLLAYIASLSMFYGQGLGSETAMLVGWTLPSYLFMLLPVCTLLHLWKRRAYAARIVLLLFSSYIAAAAVPAMMGFWFAWLVNPFSPEFLLFWVQFAVTAAVFSIGSGVTAAGRGLLIYLGFIVVAICATCYMLAQAA